MRASLKDAWFLKADEKRVILSVWDRLQTACWENEERVKLGRFSRGYWENRVRQEPGIVKSGHLICAPVTPDDFDRAEGRWTVGELDKVDFPSSSYDEWKTGGAPEDDFEERQRQLEDEEFEALREEIEAEAERWREDD